MVTDSPELNPKDVLTAEQGHDRDTFGSRSSSLPIYVRRVFIILVSVAALSCC